MSFLLARILLDVSSRIQFIKPSAIEMEHSTRLQFLAHNSYPLSLRCRCIGSWNSAPPVSIYPFGFSRTSSNNPPCSMKVVSDSACMIDQSFDSAGGVRTGLPLPSHDGLSNDHMRPLFNCKRTLRFIQSRLCYL